MSDNYVVIVYDRWDEAQISFVTGPYDNLQDAQAAKNRALEKIDGNHRQYSIQKCLSLSRLPEWEQVH